MYKLLNQDLTTHNGFQWEVGKTYTIDKPGNALCSDQVFHCYASPETAALFNPAHADIYNPICYRVECGEIVADDGLKQGTKSMQLIEPVELPVFTQRQTTIFAIYCAESALKKAGVTIPVWENWVNAFKAGETGAAAADRFGVARYNTNYAPDDAFQASYLVLIRLLGMSDDYSASLFTLKSAAYAVASAYASDVIYAVNAAAGAAAYADAYADAGADAFVKLAKRALKAS